MARRAGISAMPSPLNFCTGTYPVTVTLVNSGGNQITSATINWTLNSVAPTPVTWTGLLDTLDAASRQTDVTLTTMNFPAGIPQNFKVWSSLPNGVPDTVRTNDTLYVVKKPAISGTLTIGGASPNYPTFAAAVADLNVNGICGATVFNVRSGTYTETITLNAINGTSAVHTVPFQSETGNRNDVTLTYAPTTQIGTVNMTNADWITFQNMSIKSTGTTYSNVMNFNGGSDHNNFLNCVLQNPAMASTSTYNAVIFSSAGMDEYNSFVDNDITGGSIGAYWFGAGSTAATSEMMNRFERNKITGQYYFGLYTYYQNTITLKDNLIIRDGGYTYAYLCYAYYYFGPYVITGNKMIAKNTTYTYGLMNYAYGSTNSPSSRPIIANNCITTSAGTSTCYGLYLYYLSYALVYNNTVYNRANYASSYSVYNYYGDNFKFTYRALAQRAEQGVAIMQYLDDDGITRTHQPEEGGDEPGENRGIDQGARTQQVLRLADQGIFRGVADQPARIVHLVHDFVTGIDAGGAGNAFDLQAITDVDAGRADLHAGAAIEAPAQRTRWE